MSNFNQVFQITKELWTKIHFLDISRADNSNIGTVRVSVLGQKHLALGILQFYSRSFDQQTNRK